MRGKKKWSLAVILAVIITLVMPPQLFAGGNVNAASLNVKEKVLVVGKSFNLKLKGAKGKVTYKSQNSKVAKVSKNGKVKILAAKKTTIIVKNKGKTYKCKVRGIPAYTYQEMGKRAEKKIESMTTGDVFVDYRKYPLRLTEGKYHYDVKHIVYGVGRPIIANYGQLFIDPNTGKATWKVLGSIIKFNCA